MWDIKEIRDKSYKDNEFYAVVMCLYRLIHESKLAPEELRQALFYASYMYRWNQIDKIQIEIDPEIQREMDELDKKIARCVKS